VDPYAELSEDELQGVFAAVEEVNEEMRTSGAWIFAGGLMPAESATTVRAQSGDVMITDGPFAETKEHLGGFWVIQAEDLDAALAWAQKASAACRGAVEVRPFQDEPEV
jgi:hypothetical protein